MGAELGFGFCWKRVRFLRETGKSKKIPISFANICPQQGVSRKAPAPQTSSLVEKLLSSPGALSPSPLLSMPFSLSLPFPLCFLSAFCVLLPLPAPAGPHTAQNLRANASDHAFPTRTAKARRPTETASAFCHTCQAGLRSPPV